MPRLIALTLETLHHFRPLEDKRRSRSQTRSSRWRSIGDRGAIHASATLAKRLRQREHDARFPSSNAIAVVRTCWSKRHKRNAPCQTQRGDCARRVQLPSDSLAAPSHTPTHTKPKCRWIFRPVLADPLSSVAGSQNGLMAGADTRNARSFSLRPSNRTYLTLPALSRRACRIVTHVVRRGSSLVKRILATFAAWNRSVKTHSTIGQLHRNA